MQKENVANGNVFYFSIKLTQEKKCTWTNQDVLSFPAMWKTSVLSPFEGWTWTHWHFQMFVAQLIWLRFGRDVHGYFHVVRNKLCFKLTLCSSCMGKDYISSYISYINNFYGLVKRVLIGANQWSWDNGTGTWA